MENLKLMGNLFSLSMSIIAWTQIFLCFRVRNKWLRSLPLTLSAAVDVLFWILAIMGVETILGTSAFGAAFLGLFWVISALAGWLCFVIVKLIQKLFQ